MTLSVLKIQPVRIVIWYAAKTKKFRGEYNSPPEASTDSCFVVVGGGVAAFGKAVGMQ